MSPRGPYKKRSKLTVDDNAWRVGDIVTVGRIRWIIQALTNLGDVALEASDSSAKRIHWTTTLDRLPERIRS